MFFIPSYTIGLGIWNAALARADAAAFKAVNSGMASACMDHLMVAATTIGGGTFVGMFALCLAVFGWKTGRAHVRNAGCAGLIAIAFSTIAIQIFKHAWDRPRPLLAMFDVRIVGEPLFIHSFPSGHTSTAFAVMFAISAFIPRLRYALIPFAFLTGLSRVYVGVHFPLDVAYGALVGTALGLAAARLTRHLATGKPAPETAAGRD